MMTKNWKNTAENIYILIRNYTTYRWASITDVQEKLSILKRQHSPLFTMFCGLNCPPGSGSPLNPNPVRIPIKSGYNPDPPHGPKHIKKTVGYQQHRQIKRSRPEEDYKLYEYNIMIVILKWPLCNNYQVSEKRTWTMSYPTSVRSLHNVLLVNHAKLLYVRYLSTSNTAIRTRLTMQILNNINLTSMTILPTGEPSAVMSKNTRGIDIVSCVLMKVDHSEREGKNGRPAS